jgi:hypothetical protein
MCRKSFTDFLYVFHKKLGISIGYIQANKSDIRHIFTNVTKAFKITFGYSTRSCHIWQNFLVRGCEFPPLIYRVVLVDASVAFVLTESYGHLKGPHGVHVRSNNRHSMVHCFGVVELEFPHEIHICSASDFASFWSEKDILKVQFDIINDIRHGAVSR